MSMDLLCYTAHLLLLLPSGDNRGSLGLTWGRRSLLPCDWGSGFSSEHQPCPSVPRISVESHVPLMAVLEGGVGLREGH